jgi:hypothetical protein
MTLDPKIVLRLQFLVRVVRKECRHLVTTDQRLFGSEFSLQQATRLEEDLDLAERVEAFVGRFGHGNRLRRRRKLMEKIVHSQ